MPRFCLDSCLIGTDKHLVVEDDDVQWVVAVPPDTYHMSGIVKDNDDWCLDTVVKLSGVAAITLPPAKFVKAAEIMMNSFAGPMPWQKLLPAAEHQAFVRQLIDVAKVAMQNPALGYFETVWRAGNTVFRTLARVCVDGNEWRELVALGEGNVPAIKSFCPGIDGTAEPVHYDRFATLTGRLTVNSGPQILTLKREHRRIMKSRYGAEGSIVVLDFAALEARVLLYEYGGKCDEQDLYGMIARELGKDRKAIKGAVISELYGSSKHALGKHLGIEGKELNVFVKKVKAYFKTSDLLKRVKKQFVETGYLTNRYGRRVLVDEPLDHVLINYYAQSTGVDVTMLGFAQVVERLKDHAPRSHPVFLLHDAMLIDVHNDELDEVKEIGGVRVKGYVQHYPFKVENIA